MPSPQASRPDELNGPANGAGGNEESAHARGDGKSSRSLAEMLLSMLKWFWHVLQQTVYRWTRNDGNLLATAMAYYAAFSLFPLLVVLLSALGYALEFSQSAQDARKELIELISQTTAPELGHEVENILQGIQLRASFNSVVGPLILLFGAIGIFSQLEFAFDRLWLQITPHEHGAWPAIRNALWNRLKAFLTLIALGVMVLIAFLADLMLAGFETWAADWALGSSFWRNLQLGLSVALNALAFTLLYKLVPRVRVRWLHAAAGGLLVALLWQLGSQLVSRFLIGGHYSAYGVVGSFIAMMLWVYCASILLFLGAQFVQVLGHPEEPASRPIAVGNGGPKNNVK